MGESNQAASVQYVHTNDLTGIKPPSFNWDSDDLPQQFRTFKRYCELLLSTPTYSGKQDSDIVNYILLWLGPNALEVYDNWTHLTSEQKKVQASVWKAFEEYFEPKANFRLARFQFRDIRQQPDEPIDTYATRLKVQARKCKFDAALDDMLIDQIIIGTVHHPVRKKILDHDPEKLTLDKVLDFARTYEATQLQLNQFGRAAKVDSIHQRRNHTKKTTMSNAKPPSNNTCHFCGGTRHRREECPARDQKCNRCSKVGHWGKVCRSNAPPNATQGHRSDPKKHNASKKNKPRQKPDVHSVHVDEQEDIQFEECSFDTISISTISRDEALATIRIEAYPKRETNLRGKADTGAQGNIMPLRTFRNIYPSHVNEKGLPTTLNKCTAKLTAYNGTPIRQYGTLTIPCRFNNGLWQATTFYVADTPGPVIFGLRTCEALGLVTMYCNIEIKPDTANFKTLSDLKSLYLDCFTGLGKFKGEHSLILNEDACPVIHPPRRAPIQLQQQIRLELDRMLDLDVIRPVSEPTDWVSSLTYVQKPNGSLRICLDPKDINKALKRGQHRTPTLEEITHKLKGATVFSKLDAKSGYWSVQLDAASQHLTTFNSPFGRFCFKRLPFGLKTSQDVFQKAMDTILDGLPGVISIADDITVFGMNQADHNRNLQQLMERARKCGLVFNAEKCKINQKEISFFGNIYGESGAKPDPNKVQAIIDLKPPTTATELQSFLGMITYLAPYIPKLSDVTAPLRQLLQKNSEFQWHAEHQADFSQLKQLISNAGLLSYFDPTKPTVLQVDASQEALGAALLQDGCPISFASKSLSETEKRYANIERELLACVFGAERFHMYLYGKPFIIESDHKPLEMISAKALTSAPARLQRMLLRLQRYDYQIKYRPGKEMTLADGLSRLPRPSTDEHIELNVKVCFVQFSSRRLCELREAISSDETLTRLSKYIIQGFPERQRDAHHSIHPYWSFRDELSIENGLILKGKQLLIPEVLYDQYLTDIHAGHQGIVRCQMRARGSVYWPGINADIERLVSQCAICQKHQASQTKEPMEPVMTTIPPHPWHTIGTDLFTLNDENYLIIADYHSKYPIVERLGHDTSSRHVAAVTSHVFSMFGCPNTIISDNGPQFVGSAYQAMTNSYGINHVTSSPHHPRSHGFIERMVRSMKALIKKSPEATDKAILIYRSTPLGPQTPSPAELLFKRKIHYNLPIHHQSNNHDITATRQLAQHNSEMRYNNQSKTLRELDINQPVYYQDVARKHWLPGTIIGIGPEPRSYTVQCSTTGRSLKRNRILLRPRSIPTCTSASATPSSPAAPTAAQSSPQPASDNPTPNHISTPASATNHPAIPSTPAAKNNENTAMPTPRPKRNVVPPRRLIEEM